MRTFKAKRSIVTLTLILTTASLFQNCSRTSFNDLSSKSIPQNLSYELSDTNTITNDTTVDPENSQQSPSVKDSSKRTPTNQVTISQISNTPSTEKKELASNNISSEKPSQFFQLRTGDSIISLTTPCSDQFYCRFSTKSGTPLRSYFPRQQGSIRSPATLGFYSVGFKINSVVEYCLKPYQSSDSGNEDRICNSEDWIKVVINREGEHYTHILNFWSSEKIKLFGDYIFIARLQGSKDQYRVLIEHRAYLANSIGTIPVYTAGGYYGSTEGDHNFQFTCFLSDLTQASNWIYYQYGSLANLRTQDLGPYKKCYYRIVSDAQAKVEVAAAFGL